MRHCLFSLALFGLAGVQAQTFTLSACVTQSGVVNCLREGTTVPWTTLASQTESTATPSAGQRTASGSSSTPTAISGCHMHGSTQFCFAGTAEYEVLTQATGTEELPSQYTGCHTNGTDLFCFDEGGEEVEVIAEGASQSENVSGTSSAAATTAAPTTAETTAAASVTALTGCHMHETAQFCMASGAEYLIQTSATATEELPSQYTGCHSHGSELYCIAPTGDEVLAEAQTTSEESTTSSSSSGVSCHFHAGVEHCVNADGSDAESSCEAVDRNYNVPLRIGLIFVLLATSAIGIFAPIFLEKASKFKSRGYTMLILKQFGTGVIISTALVHLFTHAELMFANDCLGGLKYEATTAAIAMAGIVLSFLPEYIGSRIFLHRLSKHGCDTLSMPVPEKSNSDVKAPSSSDDVDDSGGRPSGEIQEQSPALLKLKVNIMEAGIIFHSLLIGLTLVVAGDSFFKTLFIVVVFHQMFEGLALGCRIAELNIRMIEKIIMATAFAVITPIGMAIGIGVLNQFNGNDASTIIAIGTLDALSAGILLWVGLVEMLAHDWMYGELEKAPIKQIIPAGLSLLTGLVLMSLLGKWA